MPGSSSWCFKRSKSCSMAEWYLESARVFEEERWRKRGKTSEVPILLHSYMCMKTWWDIWWKISQSDPDMKTNIFFSEKNWDNSNHVTCWQKDFPKDSDRNPQPKSWHNFSGKSTRLPARYATQSQSHTQWGLPAIQYKMHPVDQLIWTNKDIVFDLFPHVCASSFYIIYIYIYIYVNEKGI